MQAMGLLKRLVQASMPTGCGAVADHWGILPHYE